MTTPLPAAISNGRFLAGEWAAIRWVLSFAWRCSRKHTAALYVITACRSLLPVAMAGVAKGIVDALTAESASSAPQVNSLYPWILAAAALGVVAVSSSALRNLYSFRLSDAIQIDLGTKVLHRANELPILAFQSQAQLNTMERARSISGERFSQLLTLLFENISNAIQVISLLAVLIAIAPLAGILLVCAVPPFLVSQWKLSRERFLELALRSEQRRRREDYARLLMAWPAVAETRCLGIEPQLIHQFVDIHRDFAKKNEQYLFTRARDSLSFGVIMVIGSALLLYDLTLNALHGQSTLGDFAIFLAASTRLRLLADVGVQTLVTLRRGLLEICDLMMYLSPTPDVIATDDVSDRIDTSPKVESQCKTETIRGGPVQLALRDVSFSYPGSNRPTLSNIHFDIRPGECVALVGENGSGKSTLAHLIAGLYTPSTGSLAINGHAYASLSRQHLQELISVVFQLPTRFEASVADNILYGADLVSDTKKYEQQLERAILATGLESWIQSLPHGRKTQLGRHFGEVDLSGGQWQKLAFARAIARDAPLLILDEPTAALDVRSEHELFMQAKMLSRGRATLLISHRFSTVSMADRIIVLHQGRIEESGTHFELMANGGRYCELYNMYHTEMLRSSTNDSDTATMRSRNASALG